MNTQTRATPKTSLRVISVGLICALFMSACASQNPTAQPKPAQPNSDMTHKPQSTVSPVLPNAPTNAPNASESTSPPNVPRSQSGNQPIPLSTAPASTTSGSTAGNPPRQIGGQTVAPTLTPNRLPIEPTSVSVPIRPNPYTTEFRDYGVNPYIDPRRDRLSTFALDVDTASYSVMRSYINKGQLPPYQAIRPEEFVNYFKQDYTPPNEKGFAIYADAAPSPFQHDGSILLRVGVQAYRVPENQRKPVALTFVIDISGSMNMENRLGLVKKSLGMLIERLRRDDTVSIVVFGSNARVLLYPTVVADKNKILEAIWSMQTEGATNTEAGLKLGYDMAMRQYLPGGNNRVMMLSDGVGNVGTTDPIKLINGVKGSAPADVALSTIGFGMNNFNDVMLEQLANKGNGFYAYVDTVEEARRLFLDRTTQTLELIAKDAKVQVEFNPDVVASYRLVGYENRAIADQDFRNDTVSAGGMNSGHNATAIYAVKLHPGAQGKINTVYMRWQNPDTRQIREVSGDFNTWDIANSLEQTSARYQLSVVAVQFAEILRRSPYTNATFGQLSDYATIIARNFPNESEVQEFASLVQKAARLAN